MVRSHRAMEGQGAIGWRETKGRATKKGGPEGDVTEYTTLGRVYIEFVSGCHTTKTNRSVWQSIISYSEMVQAENDENEDKTMH